MAPTLTINQIINNNHTINNYISNLDTMTKLKELTSYHNTAPVDYETKVEGLYENNYNRFKTNDYMGLVSYDQTHFMDMIRDITYSKKRSCEDMCIIYNKDDARIYMSEGNGRWEDYQKDQGMTYLVETITSYCLDAYEVYLIRKLENESTIHTDRALALSSIEEYYRFIATFNAKPFVHKKADPQIMFNSDDSDYESDVDDRDIASHRIVDKYNGLYKRTKDSLTDAHRKVTIKSVLDVINRTTKNNIRELNNHIMTIIKVDETFKKLMIEL